MGSSSWFGRARKGRRPTQVTKRILCGVVNFWYIIHPSITFDLPWKGYRVSRQFINFSWSHSPSGTAGIAYGFGEIYDHRVRPRMRRATYKWKAYHASIELVGVDCQQTQSSGEYCDHGRFGKERWVCARRGSVFLFSWEFQHEPPCPWNYPLPPLTHTARAHTTVMSAPLQAWPGKQKRDVGAFTGLTHESYLNVRTGITLE